MTGQEVWHASDDDLQAEAKVVLINPWITHIIAEEELRCVEFGGYMRELPAIRDFVMSVVSLRRRNNAPCIADHTYIPQSSLISCGTDGLKDA